MGYERSTVGFACLLLLILACTASQPVPLQGCADVFAATTRGGARLELPRPGLERARVIQVIDGDTIVIAGGRRVRYIGIDTPEVYPRAEPLGQEATRWNRRLVGDKEVWLEKDVSETDRYGRLLRYVYVEGIMVNAELVREGLARVRAYPPDVRYHSCLQALEEEAQKVGRGIWAVSP